MQISVQNLPFAANVMINLSLSTSCITRGSEYNIGKISLTSPIVINRELKHATFLSTRTATGSDFEKKLTSHVTDVKSQTSKLPIWRLW